jgi:tetratricopeptide (TPR) repeat protein
MTSSKQKLAIVLGSVPTVDEIDQFSLISDVYETHVIASESICRFLETVSHFNGLTCIALADFDENPSYLPGLERVLAGYDVVVLKERIGVYAYQTIKVKWQHKFKLLVYVDNLTPFPANDLDQLRVIRNEVNRSADGFIVQSKSAKRALLLEGISSERIHFWPTYAAIRAERTPKTRAEALKTLRLPEGTLLITYFGQIEWEEGLVDLLAAVKIASEKDESMNRRLMVALCGVGSYTNELSDFATACNLQDKIICVTPGRSMTRALYEASEAVFVGSTPSRDRIEGDPYRIVAAMANRIPILASRSPIIEEYCGKHRMDFCAKMPESLAGAVVKLTTAAALRHDIVNQNYRKIKEGHSSEQARESMLSLLERVRKAQIVTQQIDIDNAVLAVEALVQSKQFVKAVDTIDSIFKLPEIPLHHKANLNRLIGDSFVKLGDTNMAKEAYHRALELDPYAFKVHIGLGTIHLLSKSYDLAVPQFQKAVALGPYDENANLGLGLAFEGLGELKEAMTWITASLGMNPCNLSALFSIVKLSHEMGRYDEAEKALKTYLANNPTDYSMHFSLAGIYFKQGKDKLAHEVTATILKANPNDQRALMLLEQIHARNEQISKASNNS